MEKKYVDWIQRFYPTWQSALGRCKEAAELMAKEFPELTATNGFVCVLGYPNDQATHWWCKTKTGEIVDPTAHQYQCGVFEYEEITEQHPARNFPRIRCLNCGKHYYKRPDELVMHTPQCEAEFGKHLRRGSK